MVIFLSIEWVCSFHQIHKGVCELKQFVSKSLIHYLCVNISEDINKEARATMRHLMMEAIPCPRIRAFIWLILKVELSLGNGTLVPVHGIQS